MEMGFAMLNSGQTLLQKGKLWLNSRYVSFGKWIFFLGMLYLAARFVNLNDIVAGFARVSPLTLICFLILILFSRFFYALRWHLICANGLKLPGTSTLFLLRTNLLAEFVGIAMPSILGSEVVRILKLHARTGMMGRITASIAADRLIGIASMGFIGLILLPELGMSIVGSLPISRGSLMSVMALSIVGSGVAIFWLQRRAGRLRLPQAAQQLELSAQWLAISVLLSLGGHLVFASAHYLLFVEVQSLPFLTVIALVLTTQLARSIPISVLGIGLSEGSLVALERLVGMNPEAAVTVVIITLGARYLFAIAGLLIELWCDGKIFLTAITGGADAKMAIPQ